jgi:hypothetical protein
MSSRPAEWSEIAKLFGLLSSIFHDEGRTELPPFDTMPSAAVETECDNWCRQLALNLTDPPLPPPNIRSWMLARVISVSSIAQQLATQHDTSPGPLSRQLIEHLLIKEWHGAMRDRWRLIADDSQAFTV